MKTRLIAILSQITASLLCTGISFSHAASNEAIYELEIRPSICVSYDSEEACVMMLNISWVGGNGDPICLNTAADANYITCWDNTLTGDIEQPFDDSGNVVYQLVSMQNNQILADAEVQVISRDLRDARQRRRHVWSIL